MATWRVVTDEGVREFSAAEVQRHRWEWDGSADDRTVVTHLAACTGAGLAVVEIVAPGEPSRAEEVARLTAALDGAQREERLRCIAACESIGGEYDMPPRRRAEADGALACADYLRRTADATGSAPTEPLDYVSRTIDEVLALREENARLRAAIDGRTDAPTDEELAAHDGYWRAAWSHLLGGWDWMSANEARQKRERILSSLRWWRLDRSGRVVGREIVAPTTCPKCHDAGVTAWIETMPPKPVFCDCPAGVAARVNPPEYTP